MLSFYFYFQGCYTSLKGRTCAAQYQIPLLSSPDALNVELVAVKMLMSNNTCRFVDIYDSQPHTGVKGNKILTNVYSSRSIEESQVYEFIGAEADAILEFARNKYNGCKWNKTYKDFILEVGKEKAPQNYEIVIYFSLKLLEADCRKWAA